MRLLIKYISLLLFSGLIIPFYYTTFTQCPQHAAKPASFVTSPKQPGNDQTIARTVITHIAQNIFPVLKSLISL
jgi:hypothetical protein